MTAFDSRFGREGRQKPSAMVIFQYASINAFVLFNRRLIVQYRFKRTV